MTCKALQQADVKDFRQGLRFVFAMASCMIVSCFFLIISSVGQSITARPHSAITLDPPTGWDLQEHAFDARGNALRETPLNFRRLGELKAGEVGPAHTLTLRFAETVTLTHIKSTPDFRVEQGGSCVEGGTYEANTTCMLVVRFTPVGPGRRLGSVVLSHSGSTSATTFALSGFSYEPVISFTPAQITTVPGTFSSGAGTISSATNLAIDGGDVLYIADIGNSKIKEIDSSGAINTINPAFATPVALAVDSLGIVYSTNKSGSTYYFSDFTPWGVQTAFGYTYTSTTCTVSSPCAFSAVGMSNPANISIDANDNLFLLEGTLGAAEMPVANVDQGTGTLNLWHLKDQFAYASGGPGSFAVDAAGNLYTSYIYTPNNTCIILEESLYDAEYSPSANRVAGSVKCGFSGDGGNGSGAEISSAIGQIAFDIAGNLYFADTGNQRVRRIDAATGIIRTIAGNGTAGYTGDSGPATKATLRAPAGVGVDSQGQVYVLSNSAATGTAQVVRKLGVTGSLVFPSTTQSTASATVLVNVANSGNATLNFVRDTITGANPGDFSVDLNTTNCNFAAGNYLNAGQSCQIGIVFKPAAVGARSATINLVDNTVNGVNKINLSGTGVAAATVQFTAPAAAITSGTKITIAVKVSSSYSTPTGKVSFTIDGKFMGSSALASGVASLEVGSLASGTHHVLATYSGDKYHGAANASETLTVSK